MSIQLRVCSLLVLVGVTASAHAEGQVADPPASVRRDPAVRRRYLSAMALARADVAAKRDEKARRGLEAILAEWPDDGPALSELGLLLLRTGELEEAERVSRRAIAVASSASLRAASYYNLGKLEERRAHAPAAIEAYTASLRLRGDRVVAQALERLSPGAAKALRATPRPLSGPLSADDRQGDLLRESRCQALFAERFADLVHDGIRARCRRLDVKIDLTGTGLEAAQVWEGYASANSYGKFFLVLALRTGAGWFLRPFASVWENRWNEPADLLLESVERVELHGRAALAVRWMEQIDDWSWDVEHKPNDPDNEGRGTRWRELLVAGVGPSGIPSASDEVTIGIEARPGSADDPFDEHDRRAIARVDLPTSFSDRGLVLGAPVEKRTTVPRKKWADLAAGLHPGELPVVFP